MERFCATEFVCQNDDINNIVPEKKKRYNTYLAFICWGQEVSLGVWFERSHRVAVPPLQTRHHCQDLPSA